MLRAEPKKASGESPETAKKWGNTLPNRSIGHRSILAFDLVLIEKRKPIRRKAHSQIRSSQSPLRLRSTRQLQACSAALRRL
jgi:hypothetical protein